MTFHVNSAMHAVTRRLERDIFYKNEVLLTFKSSVVLSTMTIGRLPLSNEGRVAVALVTVGGPSLIFGLGTCRRATFLLAAAAASTCRFFSRRSSLVLFDTPSPKGRRGVTVALFVVFVSEAGRMPLLGLP